MNEPAAALRSVNLVLLGPPGAGKSTIAAPLVEDYGLVMIATGKRLRTEVEAGSPLGHAVMPYLERGELVPDDLMEQLVRASLKALDPDRGCLLDGYPRTPDQARALEQMLAEHGRSLDAAIALELSDEEAVQRLSGRRICEGIDASFPVHIDDPASLERCRQRGGHLVRRDDDRPEVVRQRLIVYHQRTAPLIAFYQQCGLLRPIDASGTPDEVVRRVIAVLTAGS